MASSTNVDKDIKQEEKSSMNSERDTNCKKASTAKRVASTPRIPWQANLFNDIRSLHEELLNDFRNELKSNKETKTTESETSKVKEKKSQKKHAKTKSESEEESEKEEETKEYSDQDVTSDEDEECVPPPPPKKQKKLKEDKKQTKKQAPYGYQVQQRVQQVPFNPRVFNPLFRYDANMVDNRYY